MFLSQRTKRLQRHGNYFISETAIYLRGATKVNLADGVDVDAQTIMTGRGCIIGQSGSGKSFLIGVIAEELCGAGMPFCIIDTEGEYESLKKLFRVIVVGGENQDLDLDTDFSELFNASIANDVPIVLDVSDSTNKKEVVFGALSSLYEVEGELRKPYLVLIEEADKFAPQVIGKSMNMIEELSVRGRKRGVGMLIATQRPANISKNVLAQCSYGFIGKLTIGNDLNAIRILFETRSVLTRITKLGTGEFIPFGLGYDEKIRVKGRAAVHAGATPSLEPYMFSDKKLSAIISDLKGKEMHAKMPAAKGRATLLQVEAIPVSFSMDDARTYAEKVTKRRFVLFGNATEKIDSIELQYAPVGLCSIRLPTKHKNEYLEYYVLLDEKLELVRVDGGVTFLDTEDKIRLSRGGLRNYLRTESIQTQEVRVSRDQLLKTGLDEKKAKACMEDAFPGSVLSDFRLVYLPVYKISLREANKVRILSLEGAGGSSVNL